MLSIQLYVSLPISSFSLSCPRCCPSNSVSLFLSITSPAPPSVSLLPTHFFSLLIVWPYHFTFLYFLGYCSHFCCPPNYFILSKFVNPHIPLKILISAKSNFFSCSLFTAFDDVNVLHGCESYSCFSFISARHLVKVKTHSISKGGWFLIDQR